MEKLSSVFKALSDTIRLRIIKLLEHGELCVCDIVAALDMVQPKVSFHLGILKRAGLVTDRKQGKWIHYRLDDSKAFNKFILLSVIEKIPPVAVRDDRTRLSAFMKTKERAHKRRCGR